MKPSKMRSNNCSFTVKKGKSWMAADCASSKYRSPPWKPSRIQCLKYVHVLNDNKMIIVNCSKTIYKTLNTKASQSHTKSDKSINNNPWCCSVTVQSRGFAKDNVSVIFAGQNRKKSIKSYFHPSLINLSLCAFFRCFNNHEICILQTVRKSLKGWQCM